MKERNIKLIVILLLIAQLALVAKSFLIIKSIVTSIGGEKILLLDKIFLFGAFVFGTLVLITLVILVFYLIKYCSDQYETTVNDSGQEIRKKKKKGKDKKIEMHEGEQRKLQLVQSLVKDLHTIKEVEKFANQLLVNISKQYDIMQGVFFVKEPSANVFGKKGSYAYFNEEELKEFKVGVGLTGQVAANKKILNISNIPEKYITVMSGLGKSSPANLIIFPILFNEETLGVVELASFVKFDAFAEGVLKEFSNQVGILLSKIVTDTK